MVSAVSLIRAPGLPAVPYAAAATAPADARLVFLAGACPLDADGRTVAVGDLEPAATLQGVTVLGWEDQLVELEVVAAVVDAAPLT